MTDNIIGEASGIPGTMLVERVIQDVLTNGFIEIRQDPALVDEMFYKLRDITREDIKTYFQEHETNVVLNYPRDSGIEYPLIAVVTASDDEREDLDVLGDHMGFETFLGGTEAGYYVGHGLMSRYSIICLGGRDSNAALWLYYLAKAVLLLNRETLHRHGLHNVVLSGQDITLREDLMPEFSFTRLLTLTCVNYFAVRVTERVASKIIMSTLTENDGESSSLEEG